MNVLAGDIGGTNIRMGIFAEEGADLRILAECRFPSRLHGEFSALTRDFLRRQNLPIGCACFGVAGPVRDGRAVFTNLDWRLEEKGLAAEIGVPRVLLLNDVQALALEAPLLAETDLQTLQGGSPSAEGAAVIVAPGTGLGEAFLTFHEGNHTSHASEGGHADFAPGNPLEAELQVFVRKEMGHASIESLCSGPGIARIYRFLRDCKGRKESTSLREKMDRERDAVPMITAAAIEGDDLCREALEIFADVLAREAGNQALRFLAFGGVYIGGGIAPRIPAFLETERFRRSFSDKGSFSKLLEQMPLKVILHPAAALRGAARFAFREG